MVDNGPDHDPEPVLAVVTRSGFTESRHRGVVAGLDRDGSLALFAGDVNRPVFGRSSNKPLQAAAMVAAGLSVRSELLALVTASHSGEAVHLAAVRRLLAVGGLDENALQCPPAAPLDGSVAAALARDGVEPTRLHMNCSGKHAGMLVTCVINGWDTRDYLEPDHPLQISITARVAQLAGEPVAAIGTDGCGAPVHAVSITGLARAFRAIALAPPDSPEGAVAAVIRDHPFLVGGTGRDVTALLEAVPGLVAKDGAEGVYAAATIDGRAVAIKIDDGASRARLPVMVAALDGLGVDLPPDFGQVPVFGGGRSVGRVAAVRAWGGPRASSR